MVVRNMVNDPGWTFLSNHARVLLFIAKESEVRLREVAHRVGITERAVQRIVAELEEGGYLYARAGAAESLRGAPGPRDGAFGRVAPRGGRAPQPHPPARPTRFGRPGELTQVATNLSGARRELVREIPGRDPDPRQPTLAGRRTRMSDGPGRPSPGHSPPRRTQAFLLCSRQPVTSPTSPASATRRGVCCRRCR